MTELGVVLPAAWVRVPLDQAAFEAFVDAQLADVPVDAPWRRPLEQTLRRFHAACRDAGAVLAAVLVLADADEPVVATCTLATLTQAALGTALPLTAHTVAAALASAGHTPQLVDLPCARAVRIARQEGSTVAGVDAPAASVEHTLVPFDDGRRVAVLTCGTPSTGYTDALQGLFAEVARSLTVRSPARGVA